MGIRPQIDLGATGVVGTIERVSWDTWTSQDGQFKKEGVLINIKGWSFPIRWSVTMRGKKWNPSSSGAVGFARLVELGVTTEEAIARATFDTDRLVGMTFYWSKEKPAQWGDGIDATIYLPTGIVDGNDAAPAQTPEQQVIEALRAHPDGVAIDQMPTVLVQNKLDSLVESWFQPNGLKDRLSSNPEVEVNNGRMKLRVRA